MSTGSSRAGITNRGGGARQTPQLKGQLPHPLLFSLLYFNTYINKHVLSPQHSVLTEVRSGCVGGTNELKNIKPVFDGAPVPKSNSCRHYFAKRVSIHSLREMKSTVDSRCFPTDRKRVNNQWWFQ